MFNYLYFPINNIQKQKKKKRKKKKYKEPEVIFTYFPDCFLYPFYILYKYKYNAYSLCICVYVCVHLLMKNKDWLD